MADSRSGRGLQVVYVWKTSLPKFLAKTDASVKHISEVQQPTSTLEFLRETQRYIQDIRHPASRSGPLPSRKGPVLPNLRMHLLTSSAVSNSLSKSSIRPECRSDNQSPIPAGLMVRARSLRKLVTETNGEVRPYAITRYMPPQKLTLRLVQTHCSHERPGKETHKTFLNADIDRFMQRFEKNRRTKEFLASTASAIDV